MKPRRERGVRVGTTGIYRGDHLWFEDSPLLDSIRDHPRFQAVAAKVKADNAAMLAELDGGLSLDDIWAER